MPSWFPHDLAETVVFVPLRIDHPFLMLLFLAGLMIFAQSSAVAPFIYTLF